jgi:ABC-type multidrug transport system fused ATPase/permease subunit
MLFGSSILLLGGFSDVLYIIFTIAVSYLIIQKLNPENRKYLKGLIFLFKISSVFLILYLIFEIYLPEINSYFINRYFFKTTPSIQENTRILDNIEAFNKIIHSPIYGIGSIKVHWFAQFGTFGGQDIHPFLSFALLSGIPGLIMLLVLIYKTNLVFIKKIKYGYKYILSIAAGVSFWGLLMLSIINTTPVFFFATVQVPLGILIGIIFSNKLMLNNENLTFFSK